MKHTPGPWEFRGHWIWPVGSNDDIGRVSESYLRPGSEREANGRLIAAAPELLEALKALLNKVDHKRYNIRKDFSFFVADAAARTAIAKAEGCDDV